MGASVGVENLVCCTTRGDEAAARVIKNRHHSWQGVGEAEEFQAFFDCYETHEEMESCPRRYPLERRGSSDGHRSLGLVPEVRACRKAFFSFLG